MTSPSSTRVGSTESSARESIDLIKSGGFRVGAGEIETAILGHPSVSEVAVIGVPDADLGQRIIAVVVRKPGTPEVTEAELVELVGAELSAHKRPREVRFCRDSAT